jgi:serine/threonine protein kinase
MQTSISDNESVPPAIVSWDEVRIGKLIATGAFSAVFCTDKKDNWSSSSTSLNFDESLSAMFFEDDLEDVLTKATQESESEFGDPSHSSSSDPSLVSEDSRLVLKCLNKSSRSGKTHKAMATRGLINEASILMSLAPHPNVTRLVGVSNDLLHANPDKGFLVFDRIADSLDRILVRWQICPDDQDLSLFGPDIQWKETDLWKQSPLHWRLKHIVLGMAKGLAFLHKNSVLHRDFKPSNVGISYDGTVRILDLGSARRLPVPGGFELTKG